MAATDAGTSRAALESAQRAAARLDAGDAEAALAGFDEAVRIAPGFAEAHRARGLALRRLGRLAEAAAAFERAAALAPDRTEARLALGWARLGLGEPEPALAAFDAVLELDPQDAGALGGRGAALSLLQRYEPSLESYDSALRVTPDDAALHSNRADALLRLGRAEAAAAAADRAVGLDPGLAEARVNRGLARLALGDFAAGWEDYEARWAAGAEAQGALQASPAVRARFDPATTAADLAGRRVLLVGEQGIGDNVMFAGMAPEVIACAAQVTLAVEPRLRRLFAASFPQARATDRSPEGAALAAFDRVVPLGGLGRLYRSAREDFPGVPYLTASEAVRRRWRERLGPRGEALRIGLSWRGGTPRTGRDRRSIPLVELSPLLRLPGCEFVSLQYGDVADEIAAAGAPVRRFPAADLDDFEDLAGLVQALDLVVSVQTAVAHLAGAVGATTLILTPRAPEWRYGAAGESMPWYGSVRLIRQGAEDGWEPVIARAAAQVAALSGRS